MDRTKALIRLQSGFTLIELLVVMAITGILASLALPALGKAKNKAREVGCISNVKQLAVGMFLYVDDNGNRYPPRMPPPPAGPAFPCKPCRTTNWLVYSMDYMSGSSNIYICPSDRGVPSSFTADPSLGRTVWEHEQWSYCFNAVMTRVGTPEAILQPSDAFMGAEVFSWHAPRIRRVAYFADGHSEITADDNIAKQCAPPAQPDASYPGGYRPVP
jgi:prepilin-type N-terminal cleavage/methylation domain-containing protein